MTPMMNVYGKERDIRKIGETSNFIISSFFSIKSCNIAHFGAFSSSFLPVNAYSLSSHYGSSRNMGLNLFLAT